MPDLIVYGSFLGLLLYVTSLGTGYAGLVAQVLFPILIGIIVAIGVIVPAVGKKSEFFQSRACQIVLHSTVGCAAGLVLVLIDQIVIGYLVGIASFFYFVVSYHRLKRRSDQTLKSADD